MKKLLISTGIFLILATLLRFLYLESLPIFADESIYIRWAQIMRAEPTLRFLPLHDGKQPLFMWALIPFFKLISDPLLAGRIFSALSGLFTIPAVATIGWLLFRNKLTAAVSGIVFAVLPYVVFFNRMALVDSLLVLFVTWGFVFSYISLTKKRWDWAMLAGFAFGFAWLTKSTAIFGIALLPTLLILGPITFKKPGQLLYRALFLLPTFIIAFGMYNILRLGPEFHMIALRNQDYVFPLAEVLRHPFNPLIPHLKDSFSFFFYLLTPIGFLYVLLSLFIEPKAHWRSRLVLAIWLLFPIFAQSFVAKALTARYLLVTLPFASILIAHAVIHFGERTKNALLLRGALLLFIVPCIVFNAFLIAKPESTPLPRIERSGYLEEWTAGYGLKEVSSYIARASQNGPVVVGSEGFFGTPFDALSAYLNPYPNVRVVGVGVWIDSVSDKLTNALSDNQVFLVVNSSRFHADPANLPLKLLASYPKANPPTGQREYLLFFQVLPSK